KVVDAKENIIHRETAEMIRQIKIEPNHLEVIRGGLHDVVMSPTGTARRARVEGFMVSGKTGTAQTSALKHTKGVDADAISFKALDHAWFACFSPSDNAQIAVLVFSEYDGGGGGSQAAPIAQKIVEAYWRKKEPQKFNRG
ncbi:MAG: hypothetical protein K2X39_03420, partial [Silvanigrellaceae bacterium]|nr:hypothetical protein [Silvanigrellaceae bacterium]